MGEARAGAEASALFPGATNMSQADFDPEYVFSHHTATPEKLARYDAIHAAAKRFAQALLEQVPASSDRSAALRLVREASMMACAAVALDGRLH
jgi:hypothetical protein